MKFEELDIPEPVMEGVRAAGFTECTPVQAMSLPDALIGKDIAAQAQTGTGKTAAFLIGVFSNMHRAGLTGPSKPGSPPSVLIVAPTRELAVQIEEEAKLLSGSTGLKIISVYGGVDYDKQRELLRKGADVIIGTPGRLIDYLKQKVYSLKKIKYFVIDEADRMFDMGFISDLRFLFRRMSPYHQRQSFLFSATLTYRVMELCYEHMNDPRLIKVTPERITVEQVEQELYHVTRSEKFGLLLGILIRESEGHYLIFCNTKAMVERLGDLLSANGHDAEALTGDMPQRKRFNVLKRFRDGSLSILVATSVASRGLQIEGVTHVINYDLPQDADDYVHRIGRTARIGARGKAISLACEEYVLSLPSIEKFIKDKIMVMPLTDEMIVTGYKRPPRRKRTEPAGRGRSVPAGKGRTGPASRGRGGPARKPSPSKRPHRPVR